jgi:polyhydroxybutyrate depolymerase
MPLLLVLHGAGGSAASMARHTGLAELGVGRGYAVVHPQGIDRRWNDGRNSTAAHDDVGFIRTLLDSLTRELPVDTTRIYAAGISNGAGMAYRLACDLPGRLAAVAAVAGAPAAGLEDRCGRTLPVSLVVFQGTHDPLMPYDGGLTAVRRAQVLSAERTAALFASVNSCPHTAITSFEPDTAADGTRVRRTRYDGCPEGRGVVLYSIEGGGHTWPGGPPVGRRVGRVTRDIHASRAILDFFDRHPE